MPELLLGEFELLDKQKPNVVDGGEYEGYVGSPYVREGIGVIPIIGPISRYDTGWSYISTDTLLARIKHFEEKEFDILLHIDCPGGAVSGLFELTDYIKNSKSKITSYVGDLAASAGYLIASATSHITCSRAGNVGSVGAIIQYYKGMDEAIKTYRSAVSPLKHLPEGKRLDAQIQAQVDRVGQMFVDELVVNFNKTEEVILSTFGQGALVPSEQALEVGMINSIGSFESIFTTTNIEGVSKMTEAEMRAEMKVREDVIRAELKIKEASLADEIAKAVEAEKVRSTEALAKAKVEAVADESKRITGIDSLLITGHSELVKEMKADPSVTVEMAAIRILTAEKTSQTAAAANLSSDQVAPLATADPALVRSDAALLAEFGGDQALVDEYLAATTSGGVHFKGSK